LPPGGTTTFSLRELHPVKVRVEATSAFKQLTLTDHARGRGAVGEPARPRRRGQPLRARLESNTRAQSARRCHQEKVGREPVRMLCLRYVV
jgi:hypothetical protein